MNKLTIDSISFRNFKSYGNKTETFHFPPPGETMLVEGEVGAGKSSILDGIIYMFVGSKAFTKTIINCVSQKQCLVSGNLKFNGKPLEIIRGTKPSVFNVTGLGKSVNVDLQTRLDELLHITSKQALYNICMLSSSKTLPFFSLDKQERLKFIRNFVDSSLLDNLIALSKSEESATKLRCTEKDGKLKAMESNIVRLERMIKETEEEALEAQRKLAEEKKNIQSKLSSQEDLLTAVKKLEELKAEVEALTTSNSSAREELSRLSGICSIHEKSWNEVKGTLPGANSPEDVKRICETEITNQSKSLEQKNGIIDEIEKALSKLPTVDQFAAAFTGLEHQITAKNGILVDIRNDIKTTKSALVEYESKRAELVADQARIESEECSSYFEGLISGVSESILSAQKQLELSQIKLTAETVELEAIQKDKKMVEDKHQDFIKLGRVLADTQAHIEVLESSIGNLRREQETFVGLITQFLDSKKMKDTALTQQMSIQEELSKKNQFVTALETNIKQEIANRDRIKAIDTEYAQLTPNIDKLLDELKLARQELEDETIENDKLHREHLVIGSYRNILDEVWSYITQRIIPQLNSKLPYYTERLGLGFSMKINPRDLTKPVFSGRPGISSLSLKDDLSDGQKRLISMALAHSLRDMEASVRGIEVGWLIIDEFSNSLSPQLVEQVIDFEKAFAKERGISLIVISHDVPLKSFQWDHRTVILRDTYSRIQQKAGSKK